MSLLFDSAGVVKRVIHTGEKKPKPRKDYQYHIDGKGRVMLPGMIDAHVHVMDIGFAALSLDLSGTTSLADALNRIAKFLVYGMLGVAVALSWGYAGILNLGQGLFFGRWIVQWLASERSASSKVPISFWYLSLIGGLITLAYAIYRKDPVFIAGQSIGSIVYVRNLMLIYRENGTTPVKGGQG